MRGPRAVGAYVGDLIGGRTDRAVIGHNPLGGWSVAAMLALLAAELGLGLFTVDVDGDQPGPLAKFISFDQGREVAEWHRWVFNGLLALIAQSGIPVPADRAGVVFEEIAGGRVHEAVYPDCVDVLRVAGLGDSVGAAG